MRRFVLRTVLVLGLFSSDAHAQVNVESLRGDFDKAPARTDVEGSFAGRVGNTRSVIAGGAITGAGEVGRHVFFGTIQGDYARFDGETSVQKSFIHFRYAYQWLRWLWPEAYVQQQHDRVRLLQLREVAGTGPRFIVVDEKSVRVAAGTSYMLEYERIAVPPGAPDAEHTIAHRSSNYATVAMQIDKGVRMTSTVYVQPRWDDFGDVRSLVEASVKTALGTRLELKITGSFRYDSEPPTTVVPTDLEVKNALVAHF